MKAFVYTCEHCGAEYNITEPGQYQCQNCNNVFTVEDQEQKQAEHLKQIREKAKAEAGTDHRPNKYRWNVGFYALLGISCIFAVVTCCSVVLSVMEIIATQKKSTENMYCITVQLYLKKIETIQETANCLRSIVKTSEKLAEESRLSAEESQERAKHYTNMAEKWEEILLDETAGRYFKKYAAESAKADRKSAIKATEAAKLSLNIVESLISIAESNKKEAQKIDEEAEQAIAEHKKAEKILQDFREQNQYFLKKSAYEHKITIISAILFLLFIVATCFFRLWQKVEYLRRCKIG